MCVRGGREEAVKLMLIKEVATGRREEQTDASVHRNKQPRRIPDDDKITVRKYIPTIDISARR